MYSLSEINKMKPVPLPNNVKQIIQTLCKQVGAEIPFTIIPQKASVQDTIREVNKITEENKKEKCDLLCSILEKEDVEAFAPTLFQALCKQVFFSKTYAYVFLHLEKRWSCFRDVMEKQFQLYLASFATIEACSPEDYDAYCVWKKENDERRAFTLFLLHCGLTDHCQQVVDTLTTCITTILHVDKKEVMNEYIEHMFLLGSKAPIIETISTLKPSENCGINYKIIFRCLDILK
jgi:hypothetical protein